MTFRKAAQQLEMHKEQCIKLLKKYDNEAQKVMTNLSENLMKRIKSVDADLETSYRSISKYDFEELREYQVFF